MDVMRASTQMWFRLPRPLKACIVETAARFGTTQSAVITRALERYLQEELGIGVEVERLP